MLLFINLDIIFSMSNVKFIANIFHEATYLWDQQRKQKKKKQNSKLYIVKSNGETSVG